MKYLYLILGGMTLAFIESIAGSVSPFNYISYTLIAGTIILWLFNVEMGIVFMIFTGIFLDLFMGNWIGTTILSFFTSLLIIGIFNSIIHLDSESRRPLGGTIHLVIGILFNLFLTILKDNGFREISWNFVIYNIVISVLIFGLIWLLLNSTVVKKTNLYR